MASLNYNWLGFSLCPQELPSAQITHLSTDSAPNASSYGILEGKYKTSHKHIKYIYSYCIFLTFCNVYITDWNMKSSSELSALVESSTNQPKLEDFLGGISFADHNHKLANGYLYDGSVVASNNNAVNNVNTTNNSSSIGLSTIKSWLRSQPPQAPTTQDISENKSIDANSSSENNLASSQNLSLTMSNGVESKQGNQIVASNEPAEAAPRKAVDTFGQRTSIYRGVTRCNIVANI